MAAALSPLLDTDPPPSWADGISATGLVAAVVRGALAESGRALSATVGSVGNVLLGTPVPPDRVLARAQAERAAA